MKNIDRVKGGNSKLKIRKQYTFSYYFFSLICMLSLTTVSAADFPDVQDQIDSSSTNINFGNAVYTPGKLNSININKNNTVIKSQSATSKAILDGSGSNSTIMTISGNNITFENLIFRNSDANVFGGAINASGTNLTIINCDFTNNRAMVGGGALYFIVGTNSTVSGCTFKDNNAPIGGAIWTGTTETSLTITSSSFINNTSNNGGAIYSTNTMTIDNINFNNNKATSNGGAIYTTFH